jgi:hypothetical protein
VGLTFLKMKSVFTVPTDPRFIIPPHVFPYGIQVSFKKIREVIVNLGRSSSTTSSRLLLHKAAEKVGDPPCQPAGHRRDRGGIGIVIVAAQQVMETICATICATVPVRGVPETMKQGL